MDPQPKFWLGVGVALLALGIFLLLQERQEISSIKAPTESLSTDLLQEPATSLPREREREIPADEKDYFK